MMLLSYDSKYNPNLILQHGYDYDFLGQLISADYSNAEITDESYTYDSNGNRLTANGSTYTTSTNNELTSDGAYTYTYDDEGNRISKTNSTNRELYTWDYRNRLTSVTKQTYNAETGTWENVQIVEYTYDYNNVWIRKINGSDKTIFIPENYQTTVQIDNGTVSHYYLWTPNQQDKLLADVTNTEILWSLTDHLGTIRDIVQQTSSGLVVPAHIIYDAYGNIISCTDSTGQPISTPLLFAYTGKPFDVSTQLQNNINRWYDPTVGRWLSTDPIGFHGGSANLYLYVHSNPLQNIDWSGLEDFPYWTTFLPMMNFEDNECLFILYSGHGTFCGGTETISNINLGYAGVPAAEVPKDFKTFWDDVNNLQLVHDNVFFAFIGCWPDVINTKHIPEINQMRIKDEPFLQKNGNDMLHTSEIGDRLDVFFKMFPKFVKEKVESGCCKTVTLFIVGSANSYIPHVYDNKKTIYLRGVRFDVRPNGVIKREVI